MAALSKAKVPRERGRSGKAAGRATLSDVGREAGFSRSAVARVLLGTGGEHVRISASARTRIEKAARRLDYSPNRLAQQLRGKASRTIGVILDTGNTPVMSQRLFALESEASRRGYRLLVGQTHGQLEPLREYALDFRSRSVEVIFCLFDLAPGRDERAQSSFKKFRKVVFHGRPAWPGGYCVRVDTAAALVESIDHLVGRKKKQLALSLWNCAGDELAALRRDVFQRRTVELGLRGVVWDAASEGHEPSPAVLDRGIDFMIRKHGADAIIASNDIWATRFIFRLQRAGLRIPGDVAVLGYDNLDIASVMTPALTTVDQDHEEYATAALELLLEVAGDRAIPISRRIRTIRPRLIIREST